jgi:hypothetical protein
MAIDYGMGKVQQIPEWGRDAGRIVGKLAIGTMLSYGVANVTHNQTYGKIHQLGVYINTGLDVAGTLYKWAIRSFGKTQFKITGTAGYVQPMTPMRVAGNLMGFGSIMGALDEQKLAEALSADGLVVAEGEHGKVAIASATTGEIIVSGPIGSMKPVIQSVKGFALKGEIGEDISIES